MSYFSKNWVSLFIIGLAFLLSTVSYLSIPYSEINMLEKGFILRWAISAVFIGFIGMVFKKKQPFNVSKLVTIGFIITVLVRLVYETIIDKTSHNLWPFEMLITMAITFPSALIGAGLTYAFLKNR